MHIPSLFTGTSERNKEQPKSYQSREEAIREEGQRVNLSAHWNVGVKKERIMTVVELLTIINNACAEAKDCENCPFYSPVVGCPITINVNVKVDKLVKIAEKLADGVKDFETHYSMDGFRNAFQVET